MDERATRTAVVGIGASAGGIDALERLFRHLPVDTGLAFVIVTHLSPDRQSLLPEIVARFTSMPVEPVRSGVMMAPDHVYVMPENALVDVSSGVLQLRKLDPTHRERKPIDILLASLAQDLGEYAVGIVLSGGDGDGTLGVKALKERGGMTMAQAGGGDGPTHPDMPQSAIATGLVDFPVPAEEMGARLAEFAHSLSLLDDMAGAERSVERERFEAAQPEIYRLLRHQLGHDFSGYKTKTFNRRVQRRMQVVGLETVESYVERLRQEPSEVAALFRDLLINVTNFFRDADAFEALARMVIPKLFEGRGAEDTVRVWVPGCATGEEVYSIAILMREHMETLRNTPRVQIFATDIDEHSLSAARAARYPPALLDSVTPERRKRFFTLDGGAYVLAKTVRDLCIFSPHSVIRDPPFSRMDLVSCRNLLIYFGPVVQEQVIPTFHYSLRPNGFLFLGSSENVSQHADLFAPVDKAQRIFRAREDGRGRLPLPVGLSAPRPLNARPTSLGFGQGMPLRQVVEHHVLERLTPPHVVVNAECDVVFYSSRTGKYLEAAAGAPSRSVLAMARRGVRLELRTALREAMEGQSTVVRENVALEAEDDHVQFVTLTVEPLAGRGGDEPLYLISFTDIGPALSREVALTRTRGDPDEVVAHLERELRDTRDRLQSMIEEYETALEELKSSNEELVSVNEELQSTNEELEASKEELQSLNEELQTVNLELSHKVDDLDQSNNDLRNLFDSTQLATIFLDRKLLIRNFTPAISELFKILPTDKGRPLTDFSGRLNYADLAVDVEGVFRSGHALEKRVEGEDGLSHYLARLQPYAGMDDAAEGVIITFVDVTGVTEAEAHQRVLIAELNHRVKNMLAVAVGVARQTAKGATSVTDYAAALISRLESMARAYELLSRENWSEADVGDLARQELAPFDQSRVHIKGDAVMLKPASALSLGMILHELATNAIKYGALSGLDGVVEVMWTVAGEPGSQQLHLTWGERGGPAPASDSPQGFGLKLVQKETSHRLGGAAVVEWPAQGLVVTLNVPIKA